MTFAYKEKGSTVDENEIKRVLQRAPELRCNFLDTSDLYGYVRALIKPARCTLPCLMDGVKRNRVLTESPYMQAPHK